MPRRETMIKRVSQHIHLLLATLLCAALFHANLTIAEKENGGYAEQSLGQAELTYDESNSAGRDLGLSGSDMALAAPTSHFTHAERTLSYGRYQHHSVQGRQVNASRRGAGANTLCKSGKCIDINQTSRAVVLLWLFPSDLFSPQSMLINLRRLRL